MFHDDPHKKISPLSEERIPLELIFSILSLLPLHDIATVLTLSKEAHTIASHNYLWYQLYKRETQQVDLFFYNCIDYKMALQTHHVFSSKLALLRAILNPLGNEPSHKTSSIPLCLDDDTHKNKLSFYNIFIGTINFLSTGKCPATLTNTLSDALAGLFLSELIHQQAFLDYLNESTARLFHPAQDQSEKKLIIQERKTHYSIIENALSALFEVNTLNIDVKCAIDLVSSAQEYLRQLQQLSNDCPLPLPERYITTLLDRMSTQQRELLDREFSSIIVNINTPCKKNVEHHTQNQAAIRTWIMGALNR